MKTKSFFVTDGIPGVAAKGEIVRLSDHGIMVGRLLPMSKYHQLMKNRHLLRIPSPDPYSPPSRSPRRPKGS